MTTSKNSLRKQRRAEFHAVMNALSGEPASVEALQRLQGLKKEYFEQVDRDLAGLYAKPLERSFAGDILRTVDHGGWVTVYRPDGRTMQVKSSLWDYIQSRRQSDMPSAMAAEYLEQRAIGSLQTRQGSHGHAYRY